MIAHRIKALVLAGNHHQYSRWLREKGFAPAAYPYLSTPHSGLGVSVPVIRVGTWWNQHADLIRAADLADERFRAALDRAGFSCVVERQQAILSKRTDDHIAAWLEEGGEWPVVYGIFSPTYRSSNNGMKGMIRLIHALDEKDAARYLRPGEWLDGVWEIRRRATVGRSE